MYIFIGALIQFILLGCAVGIFYFWKRKRMWSYVCLSPFILIAGTIGYVIYQTEYTVPPSKLEVQAHQNKQDITINGIFHKKLDSYRFVTDAIAIEVPSDVEVTNMKRTRADDAEQLEWSYFHQEVGNWLNQKQKVKGKVIYLDLKAEPSFTASFHLSKEVKPSDLRLTYIHVREEPMDPLTFWKKDIKLN